MNAKEKQAKRNRKFRDENPGYATAWRLANPRKIKDAQLKCKYGISLEELNRIIDMQDGKCAICRRKLTQLGKRQTVVDHCHVIGHVRGVICQGCNTSEALMGSPKAVLALYNYMMENELLSYQGGVN
jgi:hypothetical protein